MGLIQCVVLIVVDVDVVGVELVVVVDVVELVVELAVVVVVVEVVAETAETAESAEAGSNTHYLTGATGPVCTGTQMLVSSDKGFVVVGVGTLETDLNNNLS